MDICEDSHTEEVSNSLVEEVALCMSDAGEKFQKSLHIALRMEERTQISQPEPYDDIENVRGDNEYQEAKEKWDQVRPKLYRGIRNLGTLYAIINDAHAKTCGVLNWISEKLPLIGKIIVADNVIKPFPRDEIQEAYQPCATSATHDLIGSEVKPDKTVKDRTIETPRSGEKITYNAVTAVGKDIQEAEHPLKRLTRAYEGANPKRQDLASRCRKEYRSGSEDLENTCSILAHHGTFHTEGGL